MQSWVQITSALSQHASAQAGLNFKQTAHWQRFAIQTSTYALHVCSFQTGKHVGTPGRPQTCLCTLCDAQLDPVFHQDNLIMLRWAINRGQNA